MSGPTRGFDALVSRPSPWLDGSGPKSDIVVSTRVRLARNLRHVPFTHRARDEQLQGVLASVGMTLDDVKGVNVSGLIPAADDLKTGKGLNEKRVLQ